MRRFDQPRGVDWHQYVNVFKRVNLAKWERAEKRGDVQQLTVSPPPAARPPRRLMGLFRLQDKSIGRIVYRVRGNIPASNLFRFPTCAPAGRVGLRPPASAGPGGWWAVTGAHPLPILMMSHVMQVGRRRGR